MTFAEYNTDANFDNDKSSLDELVKIGVDEGKSEDEIRNTLSAKWKNSKKINELSSYYQKHSANKKAETPKVEEKVTETAPNSAFSGNTKEYVEKQNKIADAAEEQMLNDIRKNSAKNWQEEYDSYLKRASAYKNINDHYIENLPKTLKSAYKSGEFGEPGSKDAKQRLAYFVMDNLSSVLKNFSNAAVANAGRSGVFTDTESQWEKMQKTNLENAMENRWQKYKADTEGAIKAVEKEFGNEQDARLAAEQFTRDKKANTYWNMMDQNQKVWALEVTKEIGDLLGGMDTSELANFIAGSAYMGDVNKDELIAIGVAKLANNMPDVLANLPDGNIKDIVFSMIGGNPTDIVAGIGGAGGSKKDGSSGDDLDIGLKMDDADYDKLESKAKALSADLYNGKISKDEFVKEYDKLVAEMNKHPLYKAKTKKTILSTKDTLNANKDLELKAKFGEDTKSKTFKNGKKAVDYFNNKTSLFDYFKNTAEPNYIDAKAATKNKDYKMKEYQEALAQFEILKNADAINLVGKY